MDGLDERYFYDSATLTSSNVATWAKSCEIIITLSNFLLGAVSGHNHREFRPLCLCILSPSLAWFYLLTVELTLTLVFRKVCTIYSRASRGTKACLFAMSRGNSILALFCLYSLAQCALDDTSIKLGMQLEQVVNALFSYRATADLYLIVKKWMSPLSIDLLYVMKKNF